MSFSAPSVFTTDDRPDGIDRPYEFSARTRNTYAVVGFSSLICSVGVRAFVRLRWTRVRCEGSE